MAGVKFKIGEGLIQLGSQVLNDMPDKAEGIAVGRKVAKLHILHATGYGGGQNKEGSKLFVADDTLIGKEAAIMTLGSAMPPRCHPVATWPFWRRQFLHTTACYIIGCDHVAALPTPAKAAIFAVAKVARGQRRGSTKSVARQPGMESATMDRSFHNLSDELGRAAPALQQPRRPRRPPPRADADEDVNNSAGRSDGACQVRHGKTLGTT